MAGQRKPGAPASTVEGACKAEHDALCGQVPPGQGRIVECLAAHGAGLSPGCRDAILSAK
jgi:hypothetical protein